WNIFTLPLLILIGLNLLAIILSTFVEEPLFFRNQGPEVHCEMNSVPEFPSLRKVIEEEKRVVDSTLWLLSIQLKALTAGSFFAVLTGLSQHFDATFNLTKAASIDLLSKSQIGAGLISALVSAAFIFLKLGRRKLFHPTLTLIYSLFLFGCLSLITLDYPWAEKIAVAGS
ncbi:hypothetical protein PENTCL1PPCAC_29996, partial [Pristionchus entomophagus]